MNSNHFSDWILGKTTEKGGEGSGFFGHAGRPGKQGGSAHAGGADPMWGYLATPSHPSHSIPTSPPDPDWELEHPAQPGDEDFIPLVPKPKKTVIGPSGKTGGAPESAYAGSLFDLAPYSTQIEKLSTPAKTMLQKFAMGLNGYDPVNNLRVKVMDFKIDEADPDDDEGVSEFSLTSFVYDRNDDKAGRIDVDYVDEGGYRQLHIGLLYLENRYQGSGFGTRWYEHLEKVARKSGVDRIVLQADLEVGGYYWPKLGFDFADPDDFDTAINQIGIVWKHITKRKIPQKKLESLYSAWDIAMLKCGDIDLGKKVLLAMGSHSKPWASERGYEAVKDLNNSEAISVGEAYFKAFKSKKKKKEANIASIIEKVFKR